MEKEESMASSPKGICEKLFSVFSAKPALQSFHRTTHPSNPSRPVPSQASKNHLGPQNTSPSSSEKPEKRIETEVVPIEIVAFLPSPLSSKEKQNTSKRPIPIVPSSKEEDKKKAGSANMAVKEKVEPPIVPSSEVEKKKAGSTNIDDKASDYIKRAKLKIRSTSSAGVAAIGRAISFK